MERQSLVIRGPLASRTVVAAVCAIAAVFCAVEFFSDLAEGHPAAGSYVLLVVGPTAIVLGLRALVACVRVDRRGLMLMYLFRTRYLAWDAVAGFRTAAFLGWYVVAIDLVDRRRLKLPSLTQPSGREQVEALQRRLESERDRLMKAAPGA